MCVCAFITFLIFPLTQSHNKTIILQILTDKANAMIIISWFWLGIKDPDNMKTVFSAKKGMLDPIIVI